MSHWIEEARGFLEGVSQCILEGLKPLTHNLGESGGGRGYGDTEQSFRHLHLKISPLNNPRKAPSCGWYMRTVHIKAHEKSCSLQLLHKYIQGRGLNISGGLFCCCVLHSSLSVCAWCKCLHESQTDFRNQKPYRICTYLLDTVCLNLEKRVRSFWPGLF